MPSGSAIQLGQNSSPPPDGASRAPGHPRTDRSCRVVPRQWQPAAIEDLARAQHAQPVHDPGELGDDIWESDAELQAFLADLKAARAVWVG